MMGMAIGTAQPTHPTGSWSALAACGAAPCPGAAAPSPLAPAPPPAPSASRRTRCAPPPSGCGVGGVQWGSCLLLPPLPPPPPALPTCQKARCAAGTSPWTSGCCRYRSRYPSPGCRQCRRWGAAARSGWTWGGGGGKVEVAECTGSSEPTLTGAAWGWGSAGAQLPLPDSSSHGGGLAGPVVAQEGGDLPLVEVQAQPIDGHMAAAAVNLHQVADGNSGLQLGGRLLHQHWEPPVGHSQAGPSQWGRTHPLALPSWWTGAHLGVQHEDRWGTEGIRLRVALQTSSSSGRGNSRAWGSRTGL